MTALAMRQVGLKPAAKIVLYWLADHHNGETGQCNPSIKRLADRCEMSRRSVENHLQTLKESGLISIRNECRDKGGKTANSYTLCLTDGDAQNLRMGSAKSAHGDAQNLRMMNLGIYNLGNEHIDTNVSIGAASPSKPKRRKPSKQMPDDWTPDQATALRLRDQHDLTNDDLQFCYEQFRDDAHAKDKRFADWNRAFATWVRNSVNWGQIGPGSKRRGNQVNGTGSAFY